MRLTLEPESVTVLRMIVYLFIVVKSMGKQHGHNKMAGLSVIATLMVASSWFPRFLDAAANSVIEKIFQ
jgi:hypothetical protein